MGNQEQQVLVRMFFENGQIETRPLSWVQFVGTEKIIDGEINIADAAKNIRGSEEVYFAFVDKLIGLQMFMGIFTNVRDERQRRADDRR